MDLRELRIQLAAALTGAALVSLAIGPCGPIPYKPCVDGSAADETGECLTDDVHLSVSPTPDLTSEAYTSSTNFLGIAPVKVGGCATTVGCGNVIGNGYLKSTSGLVGSSGPNADIGTSFSGGRNEQFTALAVDHDGRYVAAGNAVTLAGVQVSLVARFNTNGRLDKTFNATQVLKTSGVIESQSVYLTSVATTTGLTAGLDVFGPGIPDEAKIVAVSGSKITLNKAATASTTKGSLSTITFTNGVGTGFILGTVTGYAGGAGTTITAVAVDSQDRIIVGGWGFDQDGRGNRLAFVARYTSAGKIDTSFGPVPPGTNPGGANSSVGYVAERTTPPGLPTTPVRGIFNGITTAGVPGGTEEDAFLSLAVDSSDRILAAGYAGIFATSRIGFVARYSSSGTLDTTFGTGGFVLGHGGAFCVGSASEFWEQFTSVALDSSGNVYVTGIANGPGLMNGNFLGKNGFVLLPVTGLAEAPFITKYTSAGVYSFTSALGYGNRSVDAYNALAINTSSNVLYAAGVFYDSNGTGSIGCGFSMDNRDTVVARLNSAGTPSGTFKSTTSSFGTTGSSKTSKCTATANTVVDDQARSIAVGADGNVYVAGFSVTATTTRSLVAAYTAAGPVLNTSFNTTGYAASTDGSGFGSAKDDQLLAVAVDPAGMVIAAGTTRTVAGTTTNNTVYQTLLVRYCGIAASAYCTPGELH